MTETSRGIARKSNRINHIYGGRNHKSLIVDPVYYAHCLKYVYRNPVKAGVCKSVEDYKWSTISTKRSELNSLLVEPPTSHLRFVPVDLTELLSWLNDPTPIELEEHCRKAIKRSRFHFKPSRKGQKQPDFYAGLHTQKVPGTLRTAAAMRPANRKI